MSINNDQARKIWESSDAQRRKRILEMAGFIDLEKYVELPYEKLPLKKSTETCWRCGGFGLLPNQELGEPSKCNICEGRGVVDMTDEAKESLGKLRDRFKSMNKKSRLTAIGKAWKACKEKAYGIEKDDVVLFKDKFGKKHVGVVIDYYEDYFSIKEEKTGKVWEIYKTKVENIPLVGKAWKACKAEDATASQIERISNTILNKYNKTTGGAMAKEPLRSEFLNAVQSKFGKISPDTAAELENDNYHTEIEILTEAGLLHPRWPSKVSNKACKASQTISCPECGKNRTVQSMRDLMPGTGAPDCPRCGHVLTDVELQNQWGKRKSNPNNGPTDKEANDWAWKKYQSHWNGLGSKEQDEFYNEWDAKQKQKAKQMEEAYVDNPRTGQKERVRVIKKLPGGYGVMCPATGESYEVQEGDLYMKAGGKVFESRGTCPSCGSKEVEYVSGYYKNGEPTDYHCANCDAKWAGKEKAGVSQLPSSMTKQVQGAPPMERKSDEVIDSTDEDGWMYLYYASGKITKTKLNENGKPIGKEIYFGEQKKKPVPNPKGGWKSKADIAKGWKAYRKSMKAMTVKGLRTGDFVRHIKNGKEGVVVAQSKDGDLLVDWDGDDPNAYSEKVKQSLLEYQEKAVRKAFAPEKEDPYDYAARTLFGKPYSECVGEERSQVQGFMKAKSMKADGPEFDKEKKEHPSLPDKDIKQIVEDHDKKKAIPSWIEDAIVRQVIHMWPNVQATKVFRNIMGDGSVEEAIVNRYVNEKEIFQRIREEIAYFEKNPPDAEFPKKAQHSQILSHGSMPKERIARHSVGMKEYAEIEAAFLKEGEWHTNGVSYKYPWDVIERDKDSFKDREFFIGHNEESGLEYGLVSDVEARELDGNRWLVAKIRVPESEFTKGLLSRIENGLVRNVSTTHSFIVDPNDPERTVRKINGKAISTVIEPEVDGAKILSINRGLKANS